MNKLKKEKGITLVALIITIVVLLILAIVSIGAVKNSGIIGHAQNAATSYENAKDNETSMLAQYETILNEQQGIGPWSLEKDGETVKNSKTGETKKIGDTFTNDEVLAATGGTKSSYTGTWTILGVEKGRLKLVSTINVASSVKLGKDDDNVYKKAEDGTFVYDENGNKVVIDEIVEIFDEAGTETNLDVEKAIWSYQHAVETLDGHAKTATGITSARSIKIEDLEAEDVLKITNDKKVEIDEEYGAKYNYYYNIEKSEIFSKIKLPGSNEWKPISVIGHSAPQIFLNKEGKIVLVDSKDDEVTLDHNYYFQYSFSEEQKTKFEDSIGKGTYWIASPCVNCSTYYAYFYIYRTFTNRISTERIFASTGNPSGDSLGVRAIVYI